MLPDLMKMESRSGGSEDARNGETILLPGDSLFYDLDASHTARNDGDQVLIVLSVTLMTTDQPSTIPTDEHGDDLS
jgi:hypothetical protein